MTALLFVVGPRAYAADSDWEWVGGSECGWRGPAYAVTLQDGDVLQVVPRNDFPGEVKLQGFDTLASSPWGFTWNNPSGDSGPYTMGPYDLPWSGAMWVLLQRQDSSGVPVCDPGTVPSYQPDVREVAGVTLGERVNHDGTPYVAPEPDPEPAPEPCGSDAESPCYVHPAHGQWEVGLAVLVLCNLVALIGSWGRRGEG